MKSNIVLIDGYAVSVDAESKNWVINSMKPGCFTIKGKYQGNAFSSSIVREGNIYNVNINGSSYVVEPVPENYSPELDNTNTDESKVFAPMTGVIKDILINNGDEVSLGQLLVRIESMKLVLSVNCSGNGTIKEILVKPGQKISAGDLIMELK